MGKIEFTVRLMEPYDYDAVVAIDGKVLGERRPDYYEMKFDKLVLSADSLPTSLVAEDEKGNLVGFVMGELYVGEYGLQEAATLDTIGVDPAWQKQGVGNVLLDEFVKHVKAIGARKVITLVHPDEQKLLRFFEGNRFTPSETVSLERSI